MATTFLPNNEVVKVAGKKFLRPWGLFVIGERLANLESALTHNVISAGQVASLLEPLRLYAEANSFEFIGQEATTWYDWLLSLGNVNLTDQQITNLRNLVPRWKALMQERCQDLYMATPDTKLQPSKLLDGVNSFLSASDIAILTLREISDLSEASKCILAGSSTAAEFITLRAAESLLRRWYKKETGKAIRKQTWGEVLNLLEREYPDGKQRPKEIKFLTYLKERRDEVAHPERSSEQTEAETTFMNVCSLIVGIRIVWQKLIPPEEEISLPAPPPALQSRTEDSAQ